MRPERFHRLRAALARRQPDLTVLMDGVNKSHNFSAILRNCDAVGVLGVHVVPPKTGLPVHHGTSGGTKKWIQLHRHDAVEGAVTELKAQGFMVVAAHPAPGALDYREIDYTRPTAIMMGAELHGVSDEGLGMADAHVFIPMRGTAQSLNVSVAAAILLFEAMRQREAADMYASSRMSTLDFDRTLFEWAYPSVAAGRRAAGMPYPELGPDGELILEG